MKHNAGNRRSRNRNGAKRQGGGGGRNNYDSNGPDVKVRGTAQQVLEKYLALARDAASAGDRIRSESYFQFAEHYYRIVNVDGGANTAPSGRRDGPGYDQSPDFASEMDGSGPQPDTPRSGFQGSDNDDDADAGFEADNGPAEQTSNRASAQVAPQANVQPSLQAADTNDDAPASGRIDESVLPAAVPTPPRRRRSRGKAEENNEPTSETEVAQA